MFAVTRVGGVFEIVHDTNSRQFQACTLALMSDFVGCGRHGHGRGFAIRGRFDLRFNRFAFPASCHTFSAWHKFEEPEQTSEIVLIDIVFRKDKRRAENNVRSLNGERAQSPGVKRGSPVDELTPGEGGGGGNR